MTARPKPQFDVCHACGKLFARTNVKLCATCATNEDLRFTLVKHYLEESPQRSYQEIIEAAGITMAEINRFYAQGRLIETKPAAPGLVCTCSGKGTCPYCRYETAQKFSDLRAQMQRDLEKGPAPRVSYQRRRYREAG